MIKTSIELFEEGEGNNATTDFIIDLSDGQLPFTKVFITANDQLVIRTKGEWEREALKNLFNIL